MNVNTQWNTPPDGDFARYVERLSSEAARAVLRRSTHAGGSTEFGAVAHEVDRTVATGPGAGTAVPASGEAAGRMDVRARIAAAAARRRQATDNLGVPGAPGATGDRPAMAAGGALGFTLAKVLLGIWLAALVTLWVVGASAGIIFAAVVVGIWSAKGLRHWALPPGATSWSGWLRDRARPGLAKPGDAPGRERVR